MYTILFFSRRNPVEIIHKSKDLTSLDIFILEFSALINLQNMLLKYHTAVVGYLVFPEHVTFAAEMCWKGIIFIEISLNSPCTL